jgi:integrase
LRWNSHAVPGKLDQRAASGKTGNMKPVLWQTKNRGNLRLLIERIQSAKKARKIVNISHAISKSILITEDGDRLTMQMLRGRFEKARKLAASLADESGDAGLAAEIRNFQFRDLRAKAVSDKAEDTGSMIEAQKLLGHSSSNTTKTYVRHRRGALVKPTR